LGETERIAPELSSLTRAAPPTFPNPWGAKAIPKALMGIPLTNGVIDPFGSNAQRVWPPEFWAVMMTSPPNTPNPLGASAGVVNENVDGCADRVAVPLELRINDPSQG
jgi:hypothetical protein